MADFGGHFLFSYFWMLILRKSRKAEMTAEKKLMIDDLVVLRCNEMPVVVSFLGRWTSLLYCYCNNRCDGAVIVFHFSRVALFLFHFLFSCKTVW